MKTFTIDQDNGIMAFASAADAKGAEAVETFGSEKALATLCAGWPMSRLVEIWNNLAGMKPVAKFKDRNTGVARIWKAIQTLEVTEPVAAARVGSGCDQPPQPSAAAARDGSKKAQVLALMRQEGGVTLDDLMAATGWQKHSVRGFISGALVKKGVAVESFKREDGKRAYRLAN